MKKIWFWFKLLLVQILYFVFIVLGYFLYPIGYFFKMKLGVDLFWPFMNDEGEYGHIEPRWRRKRNIEKDNFVTAWLWFTRNPSWNFHQLVKPKSGPLENKQVYSTVQNRAYDIDWANKDTGKYGKMWAWYYIKGTLYGRYSFAKPSGLIREFQAGAAGNRYKVRLKGPINIILLGLVILGAAYLVIILKS